MHRRPLNGGQHKQRHDSFNQVPSEGVRSRSRAGLSCDESEAPESGTVAEWAPAIRLPVLAHAPYHQLAKKLLPRLPVASSGLT